MNTHTAFVVAASIVLAISADSLPAAEWEDVADSEAIFVLSVGKSVQLKQQTESNGTAQRSEWLMDDGRQATFFTYHLKGRYVFVDRNEEALSDFIQQLFPGATLGTRMERRRNRLGSRDWHRFTVEGADCVFIRQYRWDDDASDVSGPGQGLGKVRVIGFYCPVQPMSDEELETLIEAFEIWGVSGKPRYRQPSE